MGKGGGGFNFSLDLTSECRMFFCSFSAFWVLGRGGVPEKTIMDIWALRRCLPLSVQHYLWVLFLWGQSMMINFPMIQSVRSFLKLRGEAHKAANDKRSSWDGVAEKPLRRAVFLFHFHTSVFWHWRVSLQNLGGAPIGSQKMVPQSKDEFAKRPKGNCWKKTLATRLFQTPWFRA